jgi:hypothetical protein
MNQSFARLLENVYVLEFNHKSILSHFSALVKPYRHFFRCSILSSMIANSLRRATPES